MPPSPLSRRDFLRLTGLGAGAVLLGGCSPAQIVPQTASAASSTLTSPAALPAAGPLSLEINAVPAKVSLLPGAATRVWQYQGQVLLGDPACVQPIPNSYLGPTLRLQRGQQVKVRFNNRIPDPSIIHWHGLSVPSKSDGHPSQAVPQGQSYSYEFPILNRAGTYWYHPHPDMRTGPQAYYGLAGMLIVSDEEERALGLPSGEFDLPLVLQDRAFDGENQWVYTPDTMNGFFGDRVLVNGQPQQAWKVQARPYRLRLLNGSNARTYKLAWNDGAPFTVIGSDGGLLEKPLQRPYLVLAPGERLELWADFSAYKPGQELLLKSLPFTVGGGGMGMMGGGTLPNGAALDVLKFQVQPAAGKDFPRLPSRLSSPAFEDPRTAVNLKSPRPFTLNMMMTGTINGRSFNMDEVAPDEIVRQGDLEIWEFYNAGGGMGMMGGMMAMPHPMHLHLVQFQVISRRMDARPGPGYAEVSQGFVDAGWKDTVLVWPGERVQVLARFKDYAGLYLYHCHILEHEDGGMMRNYRVESRV